MNMHIVVKKPENFIKKAKEFFAGKDLSEEDIDKAFKAITEIYWRSKEKNKKYTPINIVNRIYNISSIIRDKNFK